MKFVHPAFKNAKESYVNPAVDTEDLKDLRKTLLRDSEFEVFHVLRIGSYRFKRRSTGISFLLYDKVLQAFCTAVL